MGSPPRQYQREVRTYTSPSNSLQPIHHYGASLDFPTRKHAIALTLILASFISIQFKLSNKQAKLSKQSITADTTIRIVLLTLQGCTTFTHMIISYRFRPRHQSRGVSEDAHHNCYLIANLVHESRLPGLVTTIVNPVGLPKWTQTMCVWCESRSQMSRSLTWLPGHKPTRNPNYCDIWTSKGMS